MRQSKVDKSAVIMPGAQIEGDVTIGPDVSIWYNVVLRGDDSCITIGPSTNIQDGSVIHVDDGFSTSIGSNTVVGHGCILHGCTIGNNVIVGMGSIVMNGAILENGCILGAGSLVTEGTIIPVNMMAFGRPAKSMRPVDEKEREMQQILVSNYVNKAKKKR